MSKERKAALDQVLNALKSGDAEAPAEAICTLVGDVLTNIDRIATALEKLAEVKP